MGDYLEPPTRPKPNMSLANHSAQVVVRVAGTTSNLGPGFDCLGMALDLHNLVRINLNGSTDPHGMADEAAARFFTATGIPPSVPLGNLGNVPMSRGITAAA